MSFLSRRWPLVLLALVPLLALGRALLSGVSIGPFDQIRQMAPWNGPKPSQAWDVLQADGVIQFYAWRDLVLTSWGQGAVPVWNPYQLAGTPLLANSQSGGFYPPHILLGLLHVPTGLALVLLAWFHLAWAGLGTYGLVRSLGGSRTGGAVSGVLFALSPFMLAWAALPSVITTVAWIPWILALTIEIVARNGGRKAFIGLGLCVGMLVLAGHLQFVAYGLMGAFIVGIAAAFALRKEGPKGSPIRGLGAVALALGVGVALGAPQLLPVLRFSEFSHRRQGGPTEQGYGDYVNSALRPTDLVARLANPFGQGDPTQLVTPEAPFSTFWPALSRSGANYAESALTVGPLVLMLLGLAIATRRGGRAMAPLGILALVALLLALGTPLNRLLYFYAPGWSATGSPGRIVCLFVLAMCAMAGLAFADEPTEDRKRAGIGIGIGALISLLGLIPTVDPAPQGMAADAWSAISGAASTEALAFLAAVMVAAAGVWIAVTQRARGSVALVGAALLVLVVLQVPRLVRTGDAAFLHTTPIPAPAGARVAMVNGPWGLTDAAPAMYPPNTPTAARIHDLAGYDSLMHRDTVALLREVSGQDAAPPANGNIMFVKSSATAEALAEAGVTEVWSRRELPQLGTPSGQDSGVFRYPISGPGRASTPAGTATIEAETLGSVTVRGKGPGTLVLRDRNQEGWSATVDGKPAELKGTRWREVELPEGEHRVEFRYAPPGMATGLWMALLAIVILIGTGLTLRASRKTAPPSL
ncbi:MAG: hypothetical protein ACO1SV_11455 [Fimbriimonas sp.]